MNIHIPVNTSMDEIVARLIELQQKPAPFTPGEALFWANVTPDGRPDSSTLHAGLPPTSGEKWTLSQWCRNRAPKALTA